MINTRKLKSRIVEIGKTQKECAVRLNMAASTFCQKINNVRAFSLDEAHELLTLLELPDERFAEYFFYNEVA